MERFMNHRRASVLRLLMLVVLLIGLFGQPQFHVFAAATNVTTITIPSTPAGGAALGYTAGEVVTIRVTFTAAETVTGIAGLFPRAAQHPQIGRCGKRTTPTCPGFPH